MRRVLFSLAALVALMGTGDCFADTSAHAIAQWDLYDPTLYGTVNGNVTFSGVVLFPDPGAGNNSRQVATTAWVNAAIAANGSGGGSGSGSSGTFCSTTGCTFEANGGAVTITPWNYQGYNALALDGMLTMNNGNGTNIGFGYLDDGNGANPVFNLKNAGLSMDGALTVRRQETPASSSAACTAGRFYFDAEYMYYCIASGKIGRLSWQTGW